MFRKLLPEAHRRRKALLFFRKALAVWFDADPSTIWFHCDQPSFAGTEPLKLANILLLEGWALATRGIESVTLSCDGVPVTPLTYRVARPDVAANFTHVRDALHAGFHYILDTRRLPQGLHTLTLTARSRDGRVAHLSRPAIIDNTTSEYERYLYATRPTTAGLAWMRRAVAHLPQQPCVALVLRLLDDKDVPGLDATLRSLQAQAYSHWQLCVLCPPDFAPAVAAREPDARVTVWPAPFADPLRQVSAELFGLVDAGDVLEPNALFEVVYHFNRHPSHDLVYSDEDERGVRDRRDRATFKAGPPTPGPFGRLWVARRGLLQNPDLFDDESRLVGTLAARARAVGHLAQVLYSRGRPVEGLPPRLPLPAEPSVLTHAPYPTVDLGSVHRILVVKLDHLGDVLLALPAVRRLRELFPDAEITMLVGSWSKGLVESEPAIDRVLTYDFFAPRSSEPNRELEEEECQQIWDLLAPYEFDLALDLRRDPETRDFLRLSGARFTAGYTFGDLFPWLTVALPVEPNVPVCTQRRHVSQELLQLVEMVQVFGQADVCPTVSLTTEERREAQELLAALVPAGEGPLVAIHPGAGRPIKCWPAGHFARLADRLVEELGARVVLFGAPDEVDLVRTVHEGMRHGNAAVPLAGRLTVRQLLATLGRFDLFVGNDSGPVHLAASLGLPALCVSSGTNDPTQWAPLGPRAAALQKKKLCAPCYLRRLQDCPYDIACLRELTVDEVFEAALRLTLGTTRVWAALDLDAAAHWRVSSPATQIR